jgi:hypothetical protein
MVLGGWGSKEETATMDAAEKHIIVRVFKHMLLRL